MLAGCFDSINKEALKEGKKELDKYVVVCDGNIFYQWFHYLNEVKNLELRVLPEELTEAVIFP